MSSTLINFVGAVFAAVALACWLSAVDQAKARFAPGPKPLPIIGNVLDFPRERPWIKFSAWKEQYGDMVYLNLLGTPMLILNSLKACQDLLDKRSAIYSGRPRAVMLVELMGFDYAFTSMTYTSQWRRHRRLFHQFFNSNAVLQYRTNQERGVHQFLLRALAEPEHFLNHTRLLFGETVLDVIYGIKGEKGRTFIEIAEAAIETFIEVATPGNFLVDVFPAMKCIPSWFPGGGFKKLAAKWRIGSRQTRNLAFEHTKREMENGTAAPSVMAEMLEKSNEWFGSDEQALREETPEDIVKGCAAVAYLGGADTTLSSTQTFFMAMANYPDVQREAQKELAALLGSTPSRLPNFEDKPDLPYITAIAKEVLRWQNVTPLGTPHVLTECDDEYNGYYIPKGTIVLVNAWRMLHDPEVYPDPFTFNPRRWLMETPEGVKLDPSVPDPDTIVFGFGRRTCPGRHFAKNFLFITVANVLTCFDIKALDAKGQSAERVEESFTTGLISYPVPYKVSLTPRSEHIVRLIKDLDCQ